MAGTVGRVGDCKQPACHPMHVNLFTQRQATIVATRHNSVQALRIFGGGEAGRRPAGALPRSWRRSRVALTRICGFDSSTASAYRLPPAGRRPRACLRCRQGTSMQDVQPWGARTGRQLSGRGRPRRSRQCRNKGSGGILECTLTFFPERFRLTKPACSGGWAACLWAGDARIRLTPLPCPDIAAAAIAAHALRKGGDAEKCGSGGEKSGSVSTRCGARGIAGGRRDAPDGIDAPGWGVGATECGTGAAWNLPHGAGCGMPGAWYASRPVVPYGAPRPPAARKREKPPSGGFPMEQAARVDQAGTSAPRVPVSPGAGPGAGSAGGRPPLVKRAPRPLRRPSSPWFRPATFSSA